MWNYNFVLPNIIILVTFFLFYKLQPHLSISRNRSFMRLVLLEIALIVVDIISSQCLDNYTAYPLLFLKVINILYFVLFLFRCTFFFHFTVLLFTHRAKQKKKLMFLVYLVFWLCFMVVIANFFTPTIFKIDNLGYHKGALYNSIYICAFFYCILAIVLLISYRTRFNKISVVYAIIFNVILLAGYVIRLCFPRYLIMDFFCLLSILVIYLSFENSTHYMDAKSGAFNLDALSLFLEEDKYRRSVILGIIIQDYDDMREIYTDSKMNFGIASISEFLKKSYPKLNVFYVNNGRFVLAGNTSRFARTFLESFFHKSTISPEKCTQDIKENVRKRFSYPWIDENQMVELYLDVRFIEVQKDFNSGDAPKFLQGMLTALNSKNSILHSDTVISDETLKIIEKNSDIKRIVRNAVQSRQVEMYLQPLVSSQDYKLVGAEALARIRLPDDTVMAPTVFIPVAEKNGLINLLGEQMFEKACEFVSKYDIKALGLSWINVNLSPLQFLKNDLCERFSTILKKYNVEAEQIHLEITEEAMIDYAILKKQIQNMKSAGFKFVLDDFGSGYSNVTRLNHYPFINIKLDMEIVWDYFKTHEEILPALIKSFKRTGFTVTAEGIENEDMARGMQKLGCDYLQGFYFSKPLPQEEFLKKYSDVRDVSPEEFI